MKKDLIEIGVRCLKLEAELAATKLVLAALIQKHPDHTQVQLYLTTLLEGYAESPAWAHLTDHQKELARASIEAYGSLVRQSTQIDPLKR